MRLLNVSTFKLEEFYNNIPEYAILSHTWGEGEVLYQNLNESGRMMKGWSKIENCCSKAAEDGWEYVWIDTCCIDKTSSAELSEAINSMYTWYERSSICYVYLSDVRLQSANSKDQFRNSRWFTRGWTLQELIAPKCLVFFDDVWTEIGTKSSLSHEIERITKIPEDYLIDSIDGCCIAEKMSWAAYRTTSRIEDTAYCLMGLFGINMPLLYGEGVKSFIRLQHELIRSYDDDSLFAWQGNDRENRSLFATSPQVFANTGIGYLPNSPLDRALQRQEADPQQMFSMTNKGLRFTTPLYRRDDKKTAYFFPLCSRKLSFTMEIFFIEISPTDEGNEKYFHRMGSDLLKIDVTYGLEDGWTRMPERELIFKEPGDRCFNRYLPNPHQRHVLVFKFPPTFCDFSWKKHIRSDWEIMGSKGQKLLAPNELYYDQGEIITAELNFSNSYFLPIKFEIRIIWCDGDLYPTFRIRSLDHINYCLGIYPHASGDMDFLPLKSKDSRVNGIIKVAIRPRKLEERFQGMDISGQSTVTVTYASSEQGSDWPLEERISKLGKHKIPLTLYKDASEKDKERRRRYSIPEEGHRDLSQIL